MNCEDARELSAAGWRKVGLTELALMQAHLRHCVECRDHVRSRATPRPPRPAATLADTAARLRALAATSTLAGRARLRALLAVGPALTARAGAAVGEAARRGRALSARAGTAVATRARVGAEALRAIPSVRAPWRDLPARVRARLPLPPAGRVAWLVLLAALGLYAAQDALQQRPGTPTEPTGEATFAAVRAPSLPDPGAPLDAEPPATADTGALAVAGAASPGPEQSASRPAPQFVSIPLALNGPHGGSAGGPPAQSPAVEAPQSPRVTAAAPKPEPAKAQRPAPSHVETPAPEPAPRRVPGTAHVAGQLSVKNRQAVERDLTALLARTGGTLVGTGQDGKVMFVDAVVPQSGYEEFTRGLTRIGSWRIEAERSPLPEDVHLTIRVGG